MIYITEMDLADRTRRDDFHAHYRAQIANLQTVPGFMASQRFEAVIPTASPFVAVHDVIGPDLFASATYRQRGGRGSNGDWQALMTNWHRNLYEWPGPTPDVPPDGVLVFIDELPHIAVAEIALLRSIDVSWLELAGLDRTIPSRALAMLDGGLASSAIDAAKSDGRVKVFRPITVKMLQNPKHVSVAP
jgi:hypothetical protein